MSKNPQTCCENKKKNITKNVREQEANVTAVSDLGKVRLRNLMD